MRKTILFLIFLTLSAGNIDNLFKTSKVNYPDASAVFLLQRKNFSWEGELKESDSLLIKILNKTGRDRYSDLRVRKGKGEKVEVLNAFTLKENLKRIPVGKDSINKVTPPFLSGVPFYGEGIQDMVYSFPDVEPGDGLYLEFKRKGGESFSSVQYPMERDPKERVEIEITPPQGSSLKYKVRGLKLCKREGSFIWSGKVNMVYPEEFRPPIKLLSPFLIFSTSKDWSKETSHLRNSFYSLLKKGGFEYKSGKDLGQLYKFLTVEIKTVDLPLWYGGFDFTPLGKIKENGFADQRDKALLSVFLLRKLGYKAYPVLANSEVNPAKEVSTIKQFNRFLVMFFKEKNWVFFDPADEYSILGNISFSGKEGLVLKEKGVEWVTIKRKGENSSEFSASLNLDKAGNFSGELKTQGRGIFDIGIKKTLRYMKDNEKDKFFSVMADKFLPGTKSLKWEIANIKSPFKSSFISQRISGKELGIIERGKEGEEVMILNLPENPYYFTKFPYRTSLPKRRYPLYIGEPQSFESKIKVKISGGWEPSYLPESRERSGNGWKFSVHSSFRNGFIEVVYRAKLTSKLVNLVDYNRFMNDQQILFVPSSKLVILKKKSSLTKE